MGGGVISIKSVDNRADKIRELKKFLLVLL